MKKIISLITVGIMLAACATNPLAMGAISAGVATGLKFGIKDAAKRTVIANYIYVYAAAARKITGNLTPDQFIAQLNTYIPANIKSDYPELQAFITPIITAEYQKLYSAYGTNVTKLYQGVSDLSTALEIGVSSYVSQKPV